MALLQTTCNIKQLCYCLLLDGYLSKPGLSLSPASLIVAPSCIKESLLHKHALDVLKHVGFMRNHAWMAAKTRLNHLQSLMRTKFGRCSESSSLFNSHTGVTTPTIILRVTTRNDLARQSMEGTTRFDIRKIE
jgi:hypothetical protein